MAAGVADRGRVVDHTFARNGEPPRPDLAWFVDGLARAMRDEGYDQIDEPGPTVQVVLHLLDTENPRPYRRKNAPTFVVAARLPPRDARPTCCAPATRSWCAGSPTSRCSSATGPTVRWRRSSPSSRAPTASSHQGDDDKFFAAVLERVEPLATSRLVIANEFVPDLPEALWARRRADRADRPGRRAPRRARPAPRRVPDRGDPAPSATSATSSCSTASAASATATSVPAGCPPTESTRGVPSSG